MNRKQNQRAIKLADGLIKGLEPIVEEKPDLADLLKTAVRLRDFLKPPPSMEEVLGLVPGDTVKDKAKEIGISRQHYYNLIWGTSRPNVLVAKRLADLSGVDLDTIRSIW